MADADIIRARLELHAEMAQALIDPQVEATVAAVAHAICESYRQGGKVLLFGNGGSAADAQHLAGELPGRYLLDRAPLPAIALADSAAGFSAIGNDYGFGEMFARQLRAFGRPGDVAVGLSTSGGSANVLAGLRAARDLGLVTVGVTGRTGPGWPSCRITACTSLPTRRRRSRRAPCWSCTPSASWSSTSCSREADRVSRSRRHHQRRRPRRATTSSPGTSSPSCLAPSGRCGCWPAPDGGSSW